MAETNKKSDLKNPLLSIIIPHHGGANILNECLSSLEIAVLWVLNDLGSI